MGEVVQFRFHRGNEDYEIRVITRGGDPWFVLGDVCRVLGLAHPATTARKLRECERGVHPMHTPGGVQDVTVISEHGLYRLVLRSDKPEAVEFQDWVVGEVLPSIRKTGGYGASKQDHLLERITVAVEGQTAAVRALATDVGTVKTDVSCVKDELKVHGLRLKAVETVLKENVVRRKDFQIGTERVHARVILSHWRGLCPGCNKARIVSDDAVLLPNARRDHYRAVNRPDIYHTWIICGDCHDQRHREPAEHFDPLFAAYQHWVRVLTVPSAGQLDLFRVAS